MPVADAFALAMWESWNNPSTEELRLFDIGWRVLLDRLGPAPVTISLNEES